MVPPATITERASFAISIKCKHGFNSRNFRLYYSADLIVRKKIIRENNLNDLLLFAKSEWPLCCNFMCFLLYKIYLKC